MAIMKSMKYVDFNLWMTIIAMTKLAFNDGVIKQLVNVSEKDILPEYPRDLTNFKKPSIIVMKAGDTATRSNFIGQAFDEEQNLYYDVMAKFHDAGYQIDVFADTNTQMSLITSVVCDEVFKETTWRRYHLGLTEIMTTIWQLGSIYRWSNTSFQSRISSILLNG